jgi:hypothetical protein
VLTGRLVSRDGGALVLDGDGGVRFTIREESVAEILVAPEGAAAPWVADGNQTRYLHSPSGFMLQRGQGYFSQSELFLTTVAWGVTDWLTLGVNGVLPAWFVQGGMNVGFLAKAGARLAPAVHVAGTVQTLWIAGEGDGGGSGGLAFATLTLGGRDSHVGLSVGAPFVASGGEDRIGDAAFSASAVLRVAPHVAFVTENWYFPRARRDDLFVNSLALRFLGTRLAVDTGFVFFTEADVPVPWLDFTWNF